MRGTGDTRTGRLFIDVENALFSDTRTVTVAYDGPE